MDHFEQQMAGIKDSIESCAKAIDVPVETLKLPELPKASVAQEAPLSRWVVVGFDAADTARFVDALLAVPNRWPVGPGDGVQAVVRLHSRAPAALRCHFRSVDGEAPPPPARDLSSTEAAVPWDPERIEGLGGSEGIHHFEIRAEDGPLSDGLELIVPPRLGGRYGVEDHPAWEWVAPTTRLLFLTGSVAPLTRRAAQALRRLATLGLRPILVLTQATRLSPADRNALMARNREIAAETIEDCRPEAITGFTVDAERRLRAVSPAFPEDDRNRAFRRSGFAPLLALLEEDLDPSNAPFSATWVAILSAYRRQVAELHERVAPPARPEAEDTALGVRIAELRAVQKSLPDWRRDQLRRFEQEWLYPHRKLVNDIEDQIHVDMASGTNGPVIGPILQDLRKRGLSAKQIETECPEIEGRIRDACFRAADALRSRYNDRLKTLTREANQRLQPGLWSDLESRIQHLEMATGTSDREAGSASIKGDLFDRVSDIQSFGRTWSGMTGHLSDGLGWFGLGLVGGAIGGVALGVVGTLVYGVRAESRQRDQILNDLGGLLEPIVERRRTIALDRFHRVQDQIENDTRRKFEQFFHDYEDRLQIELGELDREERRSHEERQRAYLHRLEVAALLKRLSDDLERLSLELEGGNGG